MVTSNSKTASESQMLPQTSWQDDFSNNKTLCRKVWPLIIILTETKSKPKKTWFSTKISLWRTPLVQIHKELILRFPTAWSARWKLKMQPTSRLSRFSLNLIARTKVKAFPAKFRASRRQTILISTNSYRLRVWYKTRQYNAYSMRQSEEAVILTILGKALVPTLKTTQATMIISPSCCIIITVSISKAVTW